jgi:hypothetical protein
MHHDGRRCMEIGTSNKGHTETAAKQPGAHPPELPQKPRNPPHHHRGTPAGTPANTHKSTSSPPRHTRRNARKNPEIRLITIAAHPPERPQKPRNPPHHHRGTPAGTPAKTQKSTSSPPWPIPDGKATHTCAAAQLARPGRHNPM